MPIIRPISDLRNNFTNISETVHADEEPIFLTKNGVGDMVVMSLAYYERQLAKTELYRKLEEARIDIARGAKGRNAKEYLSSFIDK